MQTIRASTIAAYCLMEGSTIMVEASRGDACQWVQRQLPSLLRAIIVARNFMGAVGLPLTVMTWSNSSTQKPMDVVAWQSILLIVDFTFEPSVFIIFAYPSNIFCAS